jgi:hypothetical protein
LKEISVYPNPSNGLVQVSVSLEKTSRLALSLTNAVGQMVSKEELGRKNKLTQNYDWGHLPKALVTICWGRISGSCNPVLTG